MPNLTSYAQSGVHTFLCMLCNFNPDLKVLPEIFCDGVVLKFRLDLLF